MLTSNILFRDVPQDDLHDMDDNDSTDNKGDGVSRPKSVDNESFLDVEEAEDLLDKEGQGVNINEEEPTKQMQEDPLTSINATVHGGKLCFTVLWSCICKSPQYNSHHVTPE